jgi:hypothetical protein
MHGYVNMGMYAIKYRTRPTKQVTAMIRRDITSYPQQHTNKDTDTKTLSLSFSLSREGRGREGGREEGRDLQISGKKPGDKVLCFLLKITRELNFSCVIKYSCSNLATSLSRFCALHKKNFSDPQFYNSTQYSTLLTFAGVLRFVLTGRAFA